VPLSPVNDVFDVFEDDFVVLDDVFVVVDDVFDDDESMIADVL